MADAAYGLWPLAVLNTLLFIVFAASSFPNPPVYRIMLRPDRFGRPPSARWAVR